MAAESIALSAIEQARDVPLFEGSIIAALLGVIMFTFWKRARAETTLDDRSTKQIDQVMRQLDERDETIKTLNDRNKELNDRNTEMMRDMIKLATSQNDSTLKAINEVRRENQNDMVLVNIKLEKTKADLDQCHSAHRAATERIQALEAGMTQMSKDKHTNLVVSTAVGAAVAAAAASHPAPAEPLPRPAV